MRYKLLCLAVVLGVIAFFLTFDVYPRAGGGQNYRSSGSRSSSSGSYRSSGSSTYRSSGSSTYRSSGGGYSTGTTYRTRSGSYGATTGGAAAGACGSCGCCFGVIVLVIIVLVILMIMRKKKGPSDSSSSSAPPPNPEMLDREVYDEGPGYAPPPPTVDQGAVNAGLAKLNEADPDFSEKEFLDKVQTAFYINQKAWTERNLEIARGYLSDGLYNRFKMQIDELIRNRRINVLENIVIGGVKIVEVKQEAGFDSIRVRIRASMTDYTIDEQSKSIVQGSKEPYGFTEYWSFIRRIGERTPGRKGEGYKSNSCPGCGAPLQISQSGNCDFCGAQVSSSLFDWVLDTITQEGAED